MVLRDCLKKIYKNLLIKLALSKGVSRKPIIKGIWRLLEYVHAPSRVPHLDSLVIEVNERSVLRSGVALYDFLPVA